MKPNEQREHICVSKALLHKKRHLSTKDNCSYRVRKMSGSISHTHTYTSEGPDINMYTHTHTHSSSDLDAAVGGAVCAHSHLAVVEAAHCTVFSSIHVLSQSLILIHIHTTARTN